MNKLKLMKPAQPRYIVEHLDNTVRIVLPSKRNILKRIWFVVWLIGWAAMTACLVFFLGGMILLFGYRLFSSLSDINSFLPLVILLMIFFLVYLSAMGLPAVYSFARQISGKEIFEANPEIMRITQQIFDWQRPREYSSVLVKDLRLRTKGLLHFFSPMEAYRELLGRNGVIAFDYEGKTIRFGLDVDEAEAKQIIAVIAQKLAEPKTI